MNDHIYIYWDDVPLAKPIDNVRAKGIIQAQNSQEFIGSMVSKSIT